MCLFLIHLQNIRPCGNISHDDMRRTPPWTRVGDREHCQQTMSLFLYPNHVDVLKMFGWTGVKRKLVRDFVSVKTLAIACLFHSLSYSMK